MIDMSGLYGHNDYSQAVANFNSSSCDGRWAEFQLVHLAVTKGKCPICECNLDGSVTRLTNKGGVTTIKPTIDHYRPKKMGLYPFLKYDHENYILMCSECNNVYKDSHFPLHVTGAIRATSKSDLINERPLIVNPIHDNIFDLFKIVFLLSPRGGRGILELRPQHNSGYLFEKANETIRLFGLGDCSVNIHQNNNVHICRIELLEEHFTKLYAVVKAFRTRQKILIACNSLIYHSSRFVSTTKNQTLTELQKKLSCTELKALKEKNRQALANELRNGELMKYGFFEFIRRGHYEDLMPS